jgi:hypothetical protein
MTAAIAAGTGLLTLATRCEFTSYAHLACPAGESIMTSGTRIRIDWIVVGLMASLAAPSLGLADFVTTVSLTNNTKQKVDDLEAVFTGTGTFGIIAPMILSNPSDAGSATISGAGTNTITINWADPGLPNMDTIKFQFETEFGAVDFNSGNWTIKGQDPIPVDKERDELSVTTVPEPSTLVVGSICALIGLVYACFRTAHNVQSRRATDVLASTSS